MFSYFMRECNEQRVEREGFFKNKIGTNGRMIILKRNKEFYGKKKN